MQLKMTQLKTFQKSIVMPWNTSEDGRMAEIDFYRAKAAEFVGNYHEAAEHARKSYSRTTAQLQKIKTQFKQSLDSLDNLLQQPRESVNRLELVDLEAKSCKLGKQTKQIKERLSFLVNYLDSIKE